MPKRSASIQLTQPYDYAVGIKRARSLQRTVSKPRSTMRKFDSGVNGTYSTSRFQKQSVTGLPRNFVSAVRKIVRAEPELKMQVQLINSGVVMGLVATTNIAAPSFQNCLFQMGQGTNDAQRIGDTITLTKAVLKFNLQRTGAAESQSPYLVRAILGKLKGRATDAPGTTEFLDLVRGSGGSPQGIYSIDVVSGLMPYNTDIWDIKWDKTFKLGKSNNSANNSNNDFNIMFHEEVNILPYIKNKLIFDNTSFAVTNDGLYLFYVVQTIDGGTYTGGNASVFGAVTYTYHDM